MKIKSDSKYDDTIRYWQSIDNYGYYYELYVLLGRKKGSIVITNDSVSIDYFTSKESVHTNITPSKLFPNQKELKWNDIVKEEPESESDMLNTRFDVKIETKATEYEKQLIEQDIQRYSQIVDKNGNLTYNNKYSIIFIMKKL